MSTKKTSWVSISEGDRVVTSPCIQPFSEAMKKSHTSDAAKICPICHKIAVVDLAPHLLAQQPDETTHVCHPCLGGCNFGFSIEKFGLSLVDNG